MNDYEKRMLFEDNENKADGLPKEQRKFLEEQQKQSVMLGRTLSCLKVVAVLQGIVIVILLAGSLLIFPRFVKIYNKLDNTVNGLQSVSEQISSIDTERLFDSLEAFDFSSLNNAIAQMRAAVESLKEATSGFDKIKDLLK